MVRIHLERNVSDKVFKFAERHIDRIAVSLRSGPFALLSRKRLTHEPYRMFLILDNLAHVSADCIIGRIGVYTYGVGVIEEE